MNVSFDQPNKIVYELINYFWRNKIFNLSLDFQPYKNGYTIVLQGESAQRPTDLEKFTRALQIGPQPAMEYYDQLLGEEPDDESLYLIGAVIDRAEISWDEGRLYVRIEKDN